MILFKVLKAAQEQVRKEIQFNRDLRRIEKLTLDYDALKRMVKEVANSNVEIVVTTADKVEIHIKPYTQQTIAYESFAEKYNKANTKVDI